MALELARAPESIRDAVNRALRNFAVADGGRRDHVRIVTGPQPFRHAHFAAADFFRVDSARGEIANVYGQRVLRVTENFPRALTAALQAENADCVEQIQYRIGQEWGRAQMRSFAARTELEWEIEFDRLSMGVMLESFWWPLRAAGWGAWKCDFSRARAGLVLIDVFDSATARSGPADFACAIYAGLFAATFAHLARRDLEAVELRCAASGVPHCTFLVAAPSRIESARELRGDNASVDEIIEKLQSAAR